MRYLSACSGIEAASVAWAPLGWEAVAFAEIEAFPSAVLAARHPGVPNWGDITKFRDWPDAAIDVLVGGTPCQSFSVAGLRKGMADPRGNLALVYLAIADRYRPQWLVWENVPGVLSSNGGADFSAFIGGLAELGYHAAWRVLDAQYVRTHGHPRAVPQRRRRVFIVGHSSDWRRAAAVLFERESLSGHPAPRREAGQESPDPTGFGAVGSVSGGYGAKLGTDESCQGSVIPVITLAIRGRGDTHQLEYRQDGTANAVLTPNGGRAGIGVGAVAFDARQSDVIQYGDKTGPLDTDGTSMAVAYSTKLHNTKSNQAGKFYEEYTPSLQHDSPPPAVAFAENVRGELREMEVTDAMSSGGGKPGQGYPAVRQGWSVRRLTPTECARLQGFPDDYLDITYRGKPAADGQKYKALGNSMAVNVMAWLGQRIAMVEALDG